MLTHSTYEKFKKDNNLFVLGLSDSTCVACCVNEPMLSRLHSDFKQGLYTHKGKNVLIARADLSKNLPFVENEGISPQSVPAIFVYFDKNYYLYEGNKDSKEELLSFINRIITPLVHLKTEEDVIAFLDLKREWNEQTKFFDKAPVSLEDLYR